MLIELQKTEVRDLVAGVVDLKDLLDRLCMEEEAEAELTHQTPSKPGAHRYSVVMAGKQFWQAKVESLGVSPVVVVALHIPEQLLVQVAPVNVLYGGFYEK